MKVIVSAIGVMLAVCILDGALAATWYVAPPPLGSNENPGTEEKPFSRIQSGIDAGSDGDTVVVAQGTYVENVKFKGRNIVLRSTNPADWAVVRQTIVDGNKAGSVVTFAGTEDETCVLSGFTLRNGQGSLYDMPLGRRGGGGGVLGSTVAPPGTHARIEYNIITANSAVQNGGGVAYAWGVLRNNLICGNSTGTCGGGISACGGIIEGNVIVGNISGALGGGVSHTNGLVRNNTVVGNRATNYGGGLAHCGTSPYPPPGGTLTNCVIWGNTSGTGAQADNFVVPAYSCIQDWTGGGVGNVGLDPRFVDPDGPDDDPNTFEDNDYRLWPSSPCIDKGKNEEWMQGAVDLDGNPRILTGVWSLTVDMGAYEYVDSCFRVLELMRPVGGGAKLTWKSYPGESYVIWSRSNLLIGAWNRKKEPIPSQGETTTWTDSDAVSTLKFYRIELR